MPRIRYVDWKPNKASLKIVFQANDILDIYEKQGYDLSLRQLYYQFVARDLIPNTERSYKRLGNIITNARDAGLIDWDRIKDRGRAIYGIPSWENAKEFLKEQAEKFHLDSWKGQPIKCQVWVEKEALVDVVARAANAWDVSYFPNKGYVSSSSIWYAAQMMLYDECDDWVVLHLGDHDPSGIDMTRDVQRRLNLYSHHITDGQPDTHIKVKRIALNMDQVEEYDPPPNPAKTTDSRFETYQDEYGNESWELDALEPSVITDLIEEKISEIFLDKRSQNKFRSRRRKTTEIQGEIAELKI